MTWPVVVVIVAALVFVAWLLDWTRDTVVRVLVGRYRADEERLRGMARVALAEERRAAEQFGAPPP